MKQDLERLSIHPSNPLSIVVEGNPNTQIGTVDNEANAKELVDAWNVIVSATSSKP